MEAGKLAYQNGDDRTAVDKMDLFLKSHARSKRADEALYYRGLARYRTGDLAGARADLEEALARTRQKPVRIRVTMALGDLAYDTGDIATAERLYLEALKDVDARKEPADHANYRLGCTLQRQGRWKEADAYFDRVIYLFGGTELAKRSATHVRCTAWTVQAGAYKNKSRAEAAAAALKQQTLSASTQPTLRDGELVFLVTVGRFHTFDKAEAELPKVRRHYADAFITTMR